jgi:hypothetical protein
MVSAVRLGCRSISGLSPVVKSINALYDHWYKWLLYVIVHKLIHRSQYVCTCKPYDEDGISAFFSLSCRGACRSSTVQYKVLVPVVELDSDGDLAALCITKTNLYHTYLNLFRLCDLTKTLSSLSPLSQ